MSRHDEVSKPGRNDREDMAADEGAPEIKPAAVLPLARDGVGGHRGETIVGVAASLAGEAIFGADDERFAVQGAAPGHMVIAQAQPAQTTPDAVNQKADTGTEDQNFNGTPGLPASAASLPSAGLRSSGGTTAPLAPIGDETARWGRDDLKHNEMGSQGESLVTAVGSAIDHLVGLADEEPGRRNGEKLISSDNRRFPGEAFGVGQGIDHLWLLGDVEYARASNDDPDEEIFEDHPNKTPAFGRLSHDALSWKLLEDNNLTGRIFDPSEAVLQVSQRSIAVDPAVGQAIFKPDGTFTFTPVPNFSGIATIQFAFTDPRTGLQEKGTITITVEADADAPSISGSAATPEDVRVATPITVTLNDADGSEVIEKVVISGLPSGAVLDWNTSLPGSITRAPDGSFVVTGSTTQIQGLLQSLSVTPPKDFNGVITLDVAATAIEANVDPALPGYRDRETLHFAYRIAVEAVADPVTATGDVKTTDEDVAVHLDNLAATFGDLLDGSEVHTVEIRGVDAGAKLRTSLGVEYPFTVASDGTHTYTLTPTQVADVYFLPPPDASGLFSGMTIVAIATERSNGDQQVASAPIRVLVNPVADPLDITAPAQATNEDMPITFGDDIGIVVNDPLTQSITSVVVSGFPVGTVVTYTPVGGGGPVTLTMSGGSITFAGGTETEIRAALATLTLTPPPNTDQNILLSISATTQDLGGVTDTRTVPMTITVAAVADGSSISGSASGTEDQPISLPVTVSRLDADGSEQYAFAEFTVPSSVTLTYPSTLPNGITVVVSGSTFTFTPGASTTPAQFESFLATGLRVQAPADSDVNFDVTVRVGTIESVLSGGEVALLRKDLTVAIPVSVNPVVDMPVVTGASAVDEDTSVNFGADIAITQNDKADGSEAITRIVLGAIPAAATVTYTAQGGTSVVVSTVAGVSTYTISGGTEDNIRATLATFTLKPPLNSDVNIPVSVAITKVDQTVTEGEAAATSTATTTHAITVAAVADGPSISGSAAGNEDQPIALPVTVARIDADGSEQYDFAEITVPAGVTLIYPATLPNAITVVVSGSKFTFSPGTTTTAAQFEAFLASGLQVRAPADSDLNFNVAVRVGTIESVLSDTGLTLLRADKTVQIPVAVTPVIDAPAISGSSAVNEDGIVAPSDQTVTAAVNFGANITITAPDSSDGSEAITRITVSGLPIGAVVTYTPIGGVATTFTVAAGTTSITLGGGGETEAQIRAALATLSLVPPPHNDADIPLTIAVSKSDATATEAEGPATQTFTATHVITVAAVADVPTITGTGAGLEDQNIPVSIAVGHADTADGSEKIKNVVISGVPAGLTLSESSPGAGVLTANGGGTYTVTGPNDAAINDVLAKLSLVFAPGGARQHLDTDFSLSVTATTIESAPSEAGGGQITLLEASQTFSVPVTVTAVVDGVTKSGASVLVEDVSKTIGSDIVWSKIDADGSESVTSVVVSGLPAGAIVTYTDLLGVVQSFTSTGAETITLTGPHSAATETAIRTALDTLNVTAPANSDTNFTLNVSITTTDNDASATTQAFTHTVVVQAVADMPSVSADAITLNEDATATLAIRPDRSIDNDNSETLSVRITVPADGAGAIGTLSGTAPLGVTFTAVGGGVYTVTAAGATPALREAALDGFLAGGVTFTPRAQWSGVLTGTNGIKVEAISTENATLYGNTTMSPDDELAPNNSAAAGTAGDLDTRIAIATTYIDITVAAVNDTPVLANAGTIVQENNNSSAVSDPDLVIPLGARLGLSIADTDGSQGLSMTLTGLPVNAQALSFGTSLAGVTTNVSIATGTVTISGANANNVLTVLASLSITLADDRDQNFTVSINGTSTDTNGVTPVSTAFSLSHAVTVQAVADTPTVDVGATTKAAVDEDTGFVTYGVTTALNDTDGSETYQSVRVQFSTPGTSARPVVQFGTTTGVTFDTSVPGQVTLTGAAADIDAAMATLQVKPGADNGEDITVTVTAIAVESNPAEANSTGPGVAGTEISVPTAQTVASFLIPVNPIPETPSLVVPASASGAEDTTFALGAISVSTGTVDPDGSEQHFIEVDTASYPAGTTFISGGSAVGTVVTAGWLRIPESALAALDIAPPANFSGTINLSVRAVITDTTSNRNSTLVTAASVIAVTVTPDADGVTPPALSNGVEDNGAVAFGADLANASTGIRVVDNTTGTGNNTATETISRIVLDFPADTATQTYSVTAGAAVGSAVVAFDAGLRAYTITSTLLSYSAADGSVSQTDRAQAEADIRATLAGFAVTMGPTHTDLNGVIAVTATTLDVNGGLANLQDNTFNHTVRIQAVADTPTISVVDPAVPAIEDGANIALTIDAGNSADADNSETLSVRITVPSDGLGVIGTIVGTAPLGVTLTNQGGGVYLVTATGATNALREAALDSFLNGGGIAFDPRANWSGSLTGTNGLKVEAISTEAATGIELAPASFGGADGTSATETVVDYIDIVVAPMADPPTVKGNAVGVEDTLIPVPMSVTLADKDGSETYIVRLTAVVPSGTRIYGAGGTEILPDLGGIYTLSPADVSALAVRPPLNYSSPLSGDIVLTAQTIVTDASGGGTDIATLSTDIHVAVRGVADVPGTRTVTVSADEDQVIELGSAIVASAGGTLNNLLADTDGSEQLSFVIGGLPAGIIPTSAVAGGVTYIGNGTWSVTAAGMPTLQLPPVPNFSGENPYSGVTVRAVTQEMDGDQATSAQWPVTIGVSPIINASTVDGFSSWNLGATVSEQSNESLASTGISLASTATHAFVDNDGSEAAVSYTFDLSNLIVDAGITANLASLPGAGSGLDKLVANYISGVFTYNQAAGTITVLAANISGIALSGKLFLDSNKDFSIPVDALVRDTAVIGGSTVTVDKTEHGTFNVDLVGTADVPTVFATSAAGNSGTAIPLSLGGVSQDTDVALGRALSESIFYVLRTTNPGTAPLFGLVDSGGNLIGIDIGNGSFVLTPAEIGDVRVITPGGVGGTISMELTSVAAENDGDRATNSTTFNVVVTPQTGSGPGTAPLPPTVTVGVNSGNEDGSITLNVTAAPAPGDTTSPKVSVVISGLPAGALVTGALLLPPDHVGDPPRWTASADDVNSGLVRVTPPADFSGTMSVTIEGIARNSNLQSATSGQQAVPVSVDPVADGVTINASPASGVEDQAVALNISLAEKDVDGSEVIGSSTYLTLGNGATLVGGYATVAAGDPDAVVGGVSMVGYYRVPTANVGSLQILPASNWHGAVSVTLAAYSFEPIDPTPDADNLKLDTRTFTVNVTARADAPDITVPVSVSGTEDTAIALPGLSAALVDTVTANGAEVLSATISGVPFGSKFSAGSNNGDGSWTVPVAALSTLTFTPPPNYSGTATLTLNGIAFELSNGDEATSSSSFDVLVAPRADSVEILAANVTIDATAQAALALNVRMADTTGTLPGENPAEHIQITFTSVPTGISMLANGGGTITNPSAGMYLFLGTEAEANAIVAQAGPTATGGTYTVSLSAVTIDGADTLATPVTDSFRLVVPQVIAGTGLADTLSGTANTQLLFGLGGADTLNGGAGADYMAGGTGNDTYVVDAAGDVIFEALGAGTDTILTTLATYSLASAANVENLTFTGVGNFSGTGNGLANTIIGGTGADTLSGGVGADTLTGGSGADTFTWKAGELGTGVDRVTDFTAGAGGDKLDVAALLTGYNPGTSVISDFVRVTASAGNTTVDIDPDGGANSFQTLATLQGITGLNVNTLLANGNLIV